MEKIRIAFVRATQIAFWIDSINKDQKYWLGQAVCVSVILFIIIGVIVGSSY